MRIKLMALSHINNGVNLNRIQTAKYLQSSRRMVNEWEKRSDEVANLSIIKLPIYSPELNPIEQVWQWLRQNELSNRCFEGYEDIVEQCCRAWNSFISDSKRSAVSVLEIGLKWEINYGDWY
jgi:transposase